MRIISMTISQACNLFHRKNVIRHAALHRGGDSQGFVNAPEVVVHEVEGVRVEVICDLLAERVGQPSKPSHAHTHGEVLALNVAH